MNCTTDNFGPLLTKYMKSAGLSDEALARQMKVANMTIYNWRTGKIRHPSRKNVLKCADALKLTAQQRTEFFIAAGLEPEVPPPPAIPVVGVPIIEPYQFFGREQLLKRIYWAWHKRVPQHVVIIGPKRSGKTSFLNYLQNITSTTYLRPEQPQGWPQDWLPLYFNWVMVDFQEAHMSRPERLMKHILHQSHLEVPSTCDIATFSSLIKEKMNKPAIILMDDIKKGLEAPTLDQEFWWNLRSLGSHGKLGFVITTTQSPAQLARELGKPSPFFNIFGDTLELEAFTKPEALELLSYSPQPFSAQESAKLLEESNCWPEPLQKLCDARLQEMLLESPVEVTSI